VLVVGPKARPAGCGGLAGADVRAVVQRGAARGADPPRSRQAPGAAKPKLAVTNHPGIPGRDMPIMFTGGRILGAWVDHHSEMSCAAETVLTSPVGRRPRKGYGRVRAQGGAVIQAKEVEDREPRESRREEGSAEIHTRLYLLRGCLRGSGQAARGKGARPNKTTRGGRVLPTERDRHPRPAAGGRARVPKRSCDAGFSRARPRW